MYEMGQKMAKTKIEEGCKLYKEKKKEDAVKIWKVTLRKLRQASNKFEVLGYLIEAYFDWGKYRDMLLYSIQQIDLANDEDNSNMRAVSYWNLARSNECLTEYHKVVCYCRHSLQNQPKDPRLLGYVYLTMGNAYLGFSSHDKALEYYEKAMNFVKQYQIDKLEMQVYHSLGRFFTFLKDYEKSLTFLSKASEMARELNNGDVSTRFQRLTCLSVAIPYKKLGRYTEAMEACEEAMKQAIAEEDRPVQGRCLCEFADIHRRKKDFERAFPRYEAAMNILVETGDRCGQIEGYIGMAKTVLLMQDVSKVCDCKSIDLLNKALDVAMVIGSKMYQYHIHSEMAECYRHLGDSHEFQYERTKCSQLLEEMDLYCEICNEIMGDKPGKLEALECFHLFHSSCASRICDTGEEGENNPTYDCPKCKLSNK